jgi:site-specific recombinase XerD
MASSEIRDRRRVLRYRNLVVKQMVQMKNRVSGLLIETGVSYSKQRPHKVTVMLRSGIDAKTVQEFAGHSDLETTLAYLAAAESEDTQARMNAIWVE